MFEVLIIKKLIQYRKNLMLLFIKFMKYYTSFENITTYY
jgi:hypothetical protein